MTPGSACGADEGEIFALSRLPTRETLPMGRVGIQDASDSAEQLGQRLFLSLLGELRNVA